MKLIKFTQILAIVGIILSFFSLFVYLIDENYSNAISTTSTIISIILGLISIVYTYVSGKETLKILNKIEEENYKLVKNTNSLVTKINHEMSKNNYDDANIKNLLKSK